MGLEILQKNPLLAQVYILIWRWDARQKFKRLQSFLETDQKILELGSGIGTVTDYFRRQNLEITPIDIKNLSLFPHVQPIIYDGTKLPFDDQTFDLVLLLTVLHHTENPVAILAEAKRVAKKILIIEDIYGNKLQQYLTYSIDSLVNWEFSEHPHNNRTDSEWQKLFDSLNLKLHYSFAYNFLWFFQQIVYLLESP